MESTFNPFYSTALAGMGWEPEYDYAGNIVAYARRAKLDDSRGARQSYTGETGIRQGTDFALERVAADKINGGNPNPNDIQYQTGGTSLIQNNPEPFKGASLLAKYFPALVAAGGAASAAGLFGAPGATTGAGLGGTGLSGEALGAGWVGDVGAGGAGLGSAAGGAAASTAPGSGSFLESLLGQSFGTEASMGAAQSAAPGFLSGATSQSLAPIGALTGVSELLPAAAGSGLLNNAPWDKIAKGLTTVAGLAAGGAFNKQDQGGPAPKAPFTPSGKTVGQKTYQPNQNNVNEMQRYLDYLAARGNPQRDARGLLGGGSTYYGLLG